jgi:putative transcriptional regulator
MTTTTAHTPERDLPVHHLDDATLMSFAAGSLPEALAAVVASHLAICPTCAAEAKRMDLIGAALFAKLPAMAVARPAPVMALRRSEADVVRDIRAAAAGDGEVPAPLARLIDGGLDNIPWRRLGLGVWHHRLPSSEGDLRLLKVAAGRRMPEHGHGGAELTLMLRGSYTDATGTYRPGDVADLDDDIEHTPIADAETGCICLIASEKPAKFKHLLPRLVQPLTGM